MPDPHSPYAQSSADTPRSGGSGNQTVIIVAIVSMTLLLMCAGTLGLGYYAVNRFVDEIANINGGLYEDEDTTVALEFAVANNEQLAGRIGELGEITYDQDRNDSSMDASGTYYTATGTEGTVTLFAELSENENEWFTSVSMLPEDEAAGSPVILAIRPVPFDSAMAKTVLEAIESSPAAKASFGEITRIGEDWDLTDQLTDDESADYVFKIDSEKGKKWVEASFAEFDFEDVTKITLINEEKTRGEVIFEVAADAKP